MIRMPTAPTPKDITSVFVELGILEMEIIAKVIYNKNIKMYPQIVSVF